MRRQVRAALLSLSGVVLLAGGIALGLEHFAVPKRWNPHHWFKADRFGVWVREPYVRHGVDRYERLLANAGVADVLPMHEILSSARDHWHCRQAPFTLPPPESQAAMVATLRLLRELKRTGTLPDDVAVASGFRDRALNNCAGGASASAHTRNAALDLDVWSRDGEAAVAQRLCASWKERGSAFRMGLGLYGGGRVHIDTQGWRTWGHDYRAASSPCRSP